MNFVSSGQGSPLVLLHGLFGNLDNLKNLSNALSAHHTVYRLDCPNHGMSCHHQKMDYPTLARVLEQFLVEQDLSSVALIGHSMGGKMAMAAALTFPERIRALIIADIAPVPYSRRHDDIISALKQLPLSSTTSRNQALSLLQQHNIDVDTAQFLLKNLKRTTAGFIWKMDLHTIEEQYDDIIDWPYHNVSYQGPCLFIRGGDSDYIGAEHKQSILQQFPNAKSKTINGTGHWLHSQKPAVFNHIVDDFLQALIP